MLALRPPTDSGNLPGTWNQGFSLGKVCFIFVFCQFFETEHPRTNFGGIFEAQRSDGIVFFPSWGWLGWLVGLGQGFVHGFWRTGIFLENAYFGVSGYVPGCVSINIAHSPISTMRVWRFTIARFRVWERSRGEESHCSPTKWGLSVDSACRMRDT